MSKYLHKSPLSHICTNHSLRYIHSVNIWGAPRTLNWQSWFGAMPPVNFTTEAWFGAFSQLDLGVADWIFSAGLHSLATETLVERRTMKIMLILTASLFCSVYLCSAHVCMLSPPQRGSMNGINNVGKKLQTLTRFCRGVLGQFRAERESWALGYTAHKIMLGC